jgi:hypothetical protein
MFHRSGTMLARHPHVDSLIGQNFKTAPLMSRVLAQGGNQTLRLVSPVDGKQRVGSAAELTHFPVVIVATRTVEAALADWVPRPNSWSQPPAFPRRWSQRCCSRSSGG